MTDTYVKRLGAYSSPVLVFGGPYSNAHATEALLQVAEQHGIGSENIICTGDVVAYAGDPALTTDLVMQSGMHVLMGNCEESFGFEGEDCGCGFDQGSACDLLSRQWYAHANDQLNDRHRRWMRTLPRQLRFEMAGLELAMIHGGVADISRWIFESTSTETKYSEIQEIEKSGAVDIVIGGHCGLPFFDDMGDKLWLNAGVIGMPANDGTPKTWYIILSPGNGGVGVELHGLDYDHPAAATRMNELKLAGAYAHTLTSGLWPNMDVLPQIEARQVGVPLNTWSISKQKIVRSAAE